MTDGGNQTTYTYDDHNKLTQYVTSAGTTTFDYDDNGNTVEMVQPGSLVTTYGYDYDNQLVGIIFPDSSTAAYAYDGAGNRVTATEGGVTSHFLYDGDQVVADYDDSWNLLAKYTAGISQRRGSTSHFSLLDGLGSVRGLLTAGQTLSDSYIYDAFGNLAAASGSTVNPYRYVGSLGYRRSDSPSGLLHLGAREYNPATGRFLTQDPIGYAGGLNLYGYVGNNPTGWVDPDGLEPKLSFGRCKQLAQDIAADARTILRHRATDVRSEHLHRDLCERLAQKLKKYVDSGCAEYEGTWPFLQTGLYLAPAIQDRTDKGWNSARQQERRLVNVMAGKFCNERTKVEFATRAMGGSVLRRVPGGNSAVRWVLVRVGRTLRKLPAAR